MRTLDGHPESEILNMIWNKAPFFMRAGGGRLEGDGPSPLTPAVKARIVELFLADRQLAAIASELGVSYSSVVVHTRHLRKDAR